MYSQLGDLTPRQNAQIRTYQAQITYFSKLLANPNATAAAKTRWQSVIDNAKAQILRISGLNTTQPVPPTTTTTETPTTPTTTTPQPTPTPVWIDRVGTIPTSTSTSTVEKTETIVEKGSIPSSYLLLGGLALILLMRR